MKELYTSSRTILRLKKMLKIKKERRKENRGGAVWGKGREKERSNDGDDSAAGGLFYFISAGVELAVTDIPSTSHC
jgi:hypothetical protein